MQRNNMEKKSCELLKLLANSLYDRECKTLKTPFFFTLGEVKIVEKWLEDNFEEDNKKPVSGDYTTPA